MTAEFLRGTGILLGLQLIVALTSYLVLHLTPRSPRWRAFILLSLIAGYHLAVFRLVTGHTVFIMGVVFVFFHLGFVFRFLSSIYYHRRPGEAPGMLFHVALLVVGPRQHYGAGKWSDLDGERFGKKLLKRWGRRLAYSLVIVLVAGSIFWVAINFRIPFRDAVIRATFLILGLELLTFCADFQCMMWSFRGRHKYFFGDFAWFRSLHIGQFWQNWNTLAVRGFQELTHLLRLRRHYFANTMIVFLTSGFLHQLIVIYYIRKLSYGTMLSFLLHGLLVYSFGRLYHARDRIPSPLRPLIFNQMTSAVATLLVSQPFVMDFYGGFVIPF